MYSCCIFFLCGTAFLGAELPCEMLTLAEAQRAALHHSEELSIAELHTLIATEKIEQIRGINLPKLCADAAYNIRDSHLGFVRKNPMYKTSSPSIPGMPPLPSQPKTIKTLATNKETRTAKVSLILPVYDFGYGSSLMKAQGSLVEASIHEKDRIQQNILVWVSTCFYRILEGSKIENVVLESLRILDKQLATARDLYSVGFVTKNDVLVVEVQLAERQQELIEVRHRIESALATLSRLIGKTVPQVTQLQDVEENIVWDANVDAIMAKADAVHPVLKKIVAHQSAAVFDCDATKAENYPDINAFVNVHTSSDTYLLHKNWVHGGIGIEIPIFDGGIVASKVAQKRKEIEALDLGLTKAFEDIHLEIRKAFFEVDSAFHRLSVAKKTIQLAEDNLSISEDLFGEGLLMSDDVLDNEGRLAQARSNYYQSLYDFYIAQSELEYASGVIQLQAAG